MGASFKIIVAGVSILAVGAVVWRVSSPSEDARPKPVSKSAPQARETTPADEEREVGIKSDEAEDVVAPLTEQDRLNLEDPARPRSAPTVRRRKLEKSLAEFHDAEGSNRFRTAGQVLTEAIAVILDADGRWKPAEGKSESAANPAEGESILTVDGRTYTISLAEFPEFDACTVHERKRLQGEKSPKQAAMTEELAEQVEARVQQAIALLESFERKR